MKTISVLILFLILVGKSFAGFSLYTIDNKFKAVFPAEPKLRGEFKIGNNATLTSYQYMDEDNAIFYSATYMGKIFIDNKNIENHLRFAVQGQIASIKGSLESYNIRNINGNKTAIYSIKYKIANIPVRQYGASFYKDDYIYSWKVQDYTPESTLDAKNIFNTYLGNFSAIE
jgi:hypothetical protein